ncbi:MAG: GntR family transcriptional regulator [Planctomyces sp.]|jgi:DNA-binding GntR family transcriptional regulator
MAGERRLLEDQVFHHLLGKISGQQTDLRSFLKPGVIAASLSVSRTTVRKAIARLVDEDWICQSDEGYQYGSRREPAGSEQFDEDDSLDHQSQIESTYWRIFDWILEGNSQGGEDVIPRLFSDQFSVSMGTVRQALDGLTRDGVLVRVPRRGWRFRSLTLSDVTDTIEIRTLFESEVLRRAGDRIPRSFLESLRNQTESIIESIDLLSESRRRRADYVFHTTIVEQSTSDVLIDVVRPLIRRSMYVGLTCPSEKRHQVRSFREHLGILDTLLKGNKLDAIDLLQAHLRRALHDTISPLLAAASFGTEQPVPNGATRIETSEDTGAVLPSEFFSAPMLK